MAYYKDHCNTIQATLGGSPSEIIYDGRIHRFQVEGSKRYAGWYIASLHHGIPYTTYGNWGTQEKYQIRGDRSDDDTRDHRQQRQHLTSDSDWKAKQTKQRACTVWSHSIQTTQHAYLTKKQINPVGVKTLDLTGLQHIDPWFVSWVNNHQLDGALVIPMYADDQLVNLQLITLETKYFLPSGKAKGAYLTLGNPSNSTRIVIATGYATGNAIHTSIGYPTICCFSDSNIDAIAGIAKKKYPQHEIIIAADNDCHSDSKKLNSGLVYSTAAAKKHDLLLAVPELDNKKVDYNGLLIALGKQAVIDSIQSAYRVNTVAKSISAEDASRQLEFAIDEWLDNKNTAGIKAPAGLGKSTRILHKVIQRKLSCDYFVPSYKLALEQVKRLPAGAAIAIRGRTHRTGTDQPLCAKWEAAEILAKVGLAHKTMPLLCGTPSPATGKRPCPYAGNCGYLKQFNSPAPIRFYAHEYLSLPSEGQLTKRPIDVAVIDETFYDSLERTQSWTIAELMTQPEQVYRDCVSAIIEGRLPLNSIDAIDALLEAEGTIEAAIHPEMDSGFASKKAKAIAELKRKPTSFLWNCKQAIEGNGINRLYVGKPDATRVFASYAKPIQFIPKETPTAFLDASLTDGLIKKIGGAELKLVEIKATRKARVTQITDSALSHHRLNADNYHLSSRLIELVYRKAHEHGPNGAVIAPKAWLDKHGSRLPTSVKTAHFGALRGLNELEHCDWLIQIGRNQPPPYAVEATARAFWPDAHLKLTSGYIRKQVTLEDREGHGAAVWVQTHADPHCRDVLEAMREQESLQALDRLRMIHADKVKEVYLISNQPLPDVVPDHLVTLDSMTLPGRLAEMALRDSVIVTDRKVMLDRYSDLFSTVDDVRHSIRDWQEESNFNGRFPNKDTYYADAHCRFVTTTYRTTDQRGGKPRTVIIPNSIDPATVPNLLAAIHGKPVRMLQQEPPPALVTRPLNDVSDDAMTPPPLPQDTPHSEPTVPQPPPPLPPLPYVNARRQKPKRVIFKFRPDNTFYAVEEEAL